MRLALATSLAAAICTFGAIAAPSAQEESAFLSRFEGQWSGGGPFRRNAESGPINVKCSLAGDGGAANMSVAGDCRAAIVISKAIGADLTYDPATGSYKGTYIGARGGTSLLAGKRNGDTLQLTVTWPKILNGDRVASMAITNTGKGQLRIKVTDKVSKDGPTEVTSDLTFEKAS